jgi:hypothetical protein
MATCYPDDNLVFQKMIGSCLNAKRSTSLPPKRPWDTFSAMIRQGCSCMRDGRFFANACSHGESTRLQACSSTRISRLNCSRAGCDDSEGGAKTMFSRTSTAECSYRHSGSLAKRLGPGLAFGIHGCSSQTCCTATARRVANLPHGKPQPLYLP